MSKTSMSKTSLFSSYDALKELEQGSPRARKTNS